MPPKAEAKSPEAKPDPKAADAAKATSAAKQRDLDAAISTITKSYGEGAIMRLGAAQAPGVGRRLEDLDPGVTTSHVCLQPVMRKTRAIRLTASGLQ